MGTEVDIDTAMASVMVMASDMVTDSGITMGISAMSPGIGILTDITGITTIITATTISISAATAG